MGVSVSLKFEVFLDCIYRSMYTDKIIGSSNELNLHTIIGNGVLKNCNQGYYQCFLYIYSQDYRLGSPICRADVFLFTTL